jgi:uncharacterized phage-associated protein
MLDQTKGQRPLTNLALQKLLYFAHAIYLIETKTPLVSGYFEAWQYGPVHPAAYAAFKSAGSRPIAFRAVKQNPLTGETFPLPNPTSPDVVSCVSRISATYARMTPGRLVEVSHAPGAPWHFIVEKARESVAFGMRIPDNIIVARFNRHKVPVGLQPITGEPREDVPFGDDERIAL